MHILQDSFCLQFHSEECSIIIKEKQWVYITAQALISHLFCNNPVFNALSNPPNPWPGLPLLRQVSCAIALNPKYKEEDKAFSTVAYSLKRSTHLTQYSSLLYRYSKTKNILLQWAECNGFFPFMFGGSKHSILPPSKLLRCEFLSVRAISSICNTWSVVVSHDHGLWETYLKQKYFYNSCRLFKHNIKIVGNAV